MAVQHQFSYNEWQGFFVALLSLSFNCLQVISVSSPLLVFLIHDDSSGFQMTNNMCGKQIAICIFITLLFSCETFSVIVTKNHSTAHGLNR